MKKLILLACFLGGMSSWAGKRPTCAERMLYEPLAPSDFFYKVIGPETAPPLVLLHGLGGASDTFQDLGPLLSKNFRVIIYDQRGHGRTAQRGWNYSLDVMARDLGTLLDHLQIKSAHLLGNSFGARTAMEFSMVFPERVRSLLVGDMEMIPRVVDYEEEYLEKARLSEAVPRFFDSLQEVYEAVRPFMSYWEAMDAVQNGTKKADGKFELVFRPHGMYLYDLGGNGADLTKALRKFTRPLLFVRADPRNSFLSDEGVRHIQRERPDVEIITVYGADHCVYGSHPRRFLEIAEEFYRKASLEKLP